MVMHEHFNLWSPMFTNQRWFNIQQLSGVVVTLIHMQSLYRIITQRFLSVLPVKNVDHQV